MKPRIVGIGELLWDLIPPGRQLGGAPANFTYHARALGADARLISRVGDDPLGREALLRLAELGIPSNGIEIDPVLPTGTAGVEVGPDGQPQFQIHPNVAWDALKGHDEGHQVVGGAAAVCFGSLSQRTDSARSAIRSLLSASSEHALRIFDVNLRQQFFSTKLLEQSLQLANVLKVSDAELPLLADMFALSGTEAAQLLQLQARFGLQVMALTRGAHGSLLWRSGEWSDHPGMATKVVDTVGAGDSFTAAMTLGLLAGWQLNQINLHANQIAAFVCSCSGATPSLPPRLCDDFLREEFSCKNNPNACASVHSHRSLATPELRSVNP